MSTYQRKKQEGISIRDIYEFVAGRWYWFLLSITICIGGMYLYLSMQLPVYERTATLLIQDDRSTRGDAYILTIKSEKNNDLENKVRILTSSGLMKKVIALNNLDVLYNSYSLLRKHDRYDNTPVQANFIDEYTESINLEVTPLNSNKYQLVVNEKRYDAEYGDTLNISNNKFYISKTDFFNKESINDPIEVTRVSPEKAALLYKENLTAKANNGSNTINLAYEGTSVKRADQILNGLFDEFNYYCESDRRKISENTARFLEDRLSLVSNELQNLSSDIPDWMQKKVATLEVNGRSSYFNDAKKGREEAIQLESSLTMAQYIKGYLADNTNRYSMLPNLGGMDELGISGQIESYNNMVVQRDRLIENSGAGNYVVSKIERTMETTHNAMLNSLNGYIQGLEMKLNHARRQEKAAQFSLTSDNGAYDVYRQKEIKKSLHELILKKQEENALSMIVTDAASKLIDAPYSSSPTKPIYPKNLLFALIVALVIPVLIWWIMVSLDMKVRNRGDIEAITSLNIIGEIPQFVATKMNKKNLVAVEYKGNDVLSENFRVLCTQLNFALKDQKVIMLTSTTSGEGKSFVSMNLAASLSMIGKKVILVDLDIRKKAKTGLLKSEQKAGVTDYLKGDITNLDELILSSKEEFMPDVLPSGNIVSDPTKLFMSNHLDEMMSILRKQYDCIIIDSVPAIGLADTLIMNRVADMTLYVIRERMLDRRFLPELEKIYREGQFKNLNIILNNCQFYSQNYYGYYNHSKYYGYNYAYGDYKNQRRKRS